MELLILHDLAQPELIFPESLQPALFSAHQIRHHCTGCFGCWIKTPGRCVITGDAQNELLRRFATCKRFAVVSRIRYGGMSSVNKIAYDRCIGFLQPFMYINRTVGEMHHPPRYSDTEHLDFFYYCDCTNEEKQTARRIAEANRVNWNIGACSVHFGNRPEDAVGQLQEVLG